MSRQLVDLREVGSSALQVGTFYVNLGTWQLCRCYLLRQVEIGVRLQAAGCAHRGHAARKIESGKAETLLVDEWPWRRHLPVRGLGESGGVVQMLVHHHQAGDHGVSRKV